MKCLTLFALLVLTGIAAAQDGAAIAGIPISDVPRVVDQELIGAWQWSDSTELNEGFAAFAQGTALLSNAAGDQPLPFTYKLSNDGTERSIAITLQGDERVVLYGFYSIDGDVMKMTLGQLDHASKTPAPKTMEEAPKSWRRLVFERSTPKSQNSDTGVRRNRVRTAISDGPPHTT